MGNHSNILRHCSSGIPSLRWLGNGRLTWTSFSRSGAYVLAQRAVWNKTTRTAMRTTSVADVPRPPALVVGAPLWRCPDSRSCRQTVLRQSETPKCVRSAARRTLQRLAPLQQPSNVSRFMENQGAKSLQAGVPSSTTVGTASHARFCTRKAAKMALSVHSATSATLVRKRSV